MTTKLLVFVLALTAGAACAQNYPNKAVRLVVPFLAGGSTDIVGRTVAQKLSEMWGQQVFVDNRPGGGTTIGTDNVAKFNHDSLPTFGVGKDRKPVEWRSIFRQLSATGLIAQDLMEHGRWQVTDEGRRVLKGEARIELRKNLGAPAPDAGRRGKRATTTIVGDADVMLLSALKVLRSTLAQAQRVPAYVVFSDRTLAELATHRPASLPAMREIHGIGDAKLQRYGAAFLQVIQSAG